MEKEEGTLARALQDGWVAWTNKAILKQGFYLSLVFQFTLIVLPYIIWKPACFPGPMEGVGDMFIVMLLSLAGLVAVAGAGGIYHAVSKKDLTGDRLVRPLQVTAILGNALGFLLVLFSLFLGLNYTTGLQVGGAMSIDPAALPPTLLLVGTVVSEALHVVLLVLFLDVKKEDFGKGCIWGLLFTMIPVAAGCISFTSPFIPGGIFLAFTASMMMFGISAFTIAPGSLNVVKRKSTRDVLELAKSSLAVEVTSFNITGYLFLIGFLLFHYMGPAFSQDEVIFQHAIALLLIPLIIASGVAFLGRLFGGSQLHGRLLGGVAINLLLVALASFKDLADINWAYIRASLVGVAIGLVIEPLFRSLLKFKFYKKPYAKMTGYACLSVVVASLLTGLSAIWTASKTTFTASQQSLFSYIFILLSVVPLAGTLGFSNEIKFNDKFKWEKLMKAVLLVLLIAGFSMLVLDAIVTELVVDGWAGLAAQLQE
ncbi:MAG: hypothetical protein ACFFCS_06825 [Candidatus Hodarchaeota archaeon]